MDSVSAVTAASAKEICSEAMLVDQNSLKRLQISDSDTDTYSDYMCTTNEVCLKSPKRGKRRKKQKNVKQIPIDANSKSTTLPSLCHVQSSLLPSVNKDTDAHQSNTAITTESNNRTAMAIEINEINELRLIVDRQS